MVAAETPFFSCLSSESWLPEQLMPETSSQSADWIGDQSLETEAGPCRRHTERVHTEAGPCQTNTESSTHPMMGCMVLLQVTLCAVCIGHEPGFDGSFVAQRNCQVLCIALGALLCVCVCVCWQGRGYLVIVLSHWQHTACWVQQVLLCLACDWLPCYTLFCSAGTGADTTHLTSAMRLAWRPIVHTCWGHVGTQYVCLGRLGGHVQYGMAQGSGS